MLVQLRIRDLGLFAEAELTLGPGLQVITGETGVGKSMLLDSLALLRGERARTDSIRRGADTARVQGFFVLEEPARRARLEDRVGTEFPDGELLLERQLRASGRHRSRANGQEIPRAFLSTVGRELFEVQGQRSQLALLDPTHQLAALDRFAGLTDEVDAYGARYTASRALAARIDALHEEQRARNDRRLFLDHVVAELEGAELRLGERAALERDLQFLEERDRLLQELADARQSLREADGSVIDTLAGLERQLEGFRELDGGLREFLEACEGARLLLEEALHPLSGVADRLDQDPEALARGRQRIEELLRLEERYRRSGDELADYLVEAREERDGLVEAEQGLPELEAELHEELAALGEVARSLGKRRRGAAQRLARTVAAELQDLGLSEAAFKIELTRLTREEGWLGLDAHGGDHMEFTFGPNPGEPLRPLRETASGGELSRVMLSLKRALALREGVPILIFDEIDAGVGGRLGTELGRKLREIGETHQVICVTHMPQIACFGTRHLHVTKCVEKGRTVAQVEELVGDRRVEEIAAMIRGKSRKSTSLAEARDMLEEAVRDPMRNTGPGPRKGGTSDVRRKKKSRTGR